MREFCLNPLLLRWHHRALIDTNTDGIPDAAQGTPPAPNSSDDYIVAQTVYNDSSFGGPMMDSIDNAGRTSETQSDLLGHTIRTIENLDNGTVEETDTNKDVTTEYQYDSSGRMVTMIAYNAKGSSNGVEEQATKYL